MQTGEIATIIKFGKYSLMVKVPYGRNDLSPSGIAYGGFYDPSTFYIDWPGTAGRVEGVLSADAKTISFTDNSGSQWTWSKN